MLALLFLINWSIFWSYSSLDNLRIVVAEFFYKLCAFPVAQQSPNTTNLVVFVWCEKVKCIENRKYVGSEMRTLLTMVCISRPKLSIV